MAWLARSAPGTVRQHGPGARDAARRARTPEPDSRLAASSGNRDLARAHHLDQAERPDHPLEGLDLVGRPGDLDDDRALRHVDDLAAEDLADLHDLRALRAVDGDLEERELAGDRVARLEVADLQDVDELVQLLRDLVDRVQRPVDG